MIVARNIEKMEDRFWVRVGDHTPVIQASYSVNPGDYTYVITAEDPYLLQAFKFGMTPYYAEKPMNIINARAEGDKNKNNDPYYTGPCALFLKKEFKKPVQFQRCLVIADAYYDWTDRNKPYLIFLQNKDRPFAIAGVYDKWVNPETKEKEISFAIITTSANPLLQGIGLQRMPAILSQSNELNWIKSSAHLSDILRLLVPYPSHKMNAYPVSERVNEIGVNEASLINPVGEKIQNENMQSNVIKGYRSHKEKPQSDRLLRTWNSNKES